MIQWSSKGVFVSPEMSLSSGFNFLRVPEFSFASLTKTLGLPEEGWLLIDVPNPSANTGVYNIVSDLVSGESATFSEIKSMVSFLSFTGWEFVVVKSHLDGDILLIALPEDEIMTAPPTYYDNWVRLDKSIFYLVLATQKESNSMPLGDSL
jgi:hypothetical protein